jgi:hypothetical protein
MSDGLPTDEQLRRIERGVQRRIDTRRRIAQRVAGTAVAVLLLAGGIALIGPLTSISTSGAAGGSSGSRGSVAATEPVTCHDGGTTTRVSAARDGLPGSAVRACTQPAQAADASRRPSADQESGARPVLCRAPSGALHVYLAGGCAEHDMTRVEGAG